MSPPPPPPPLWSRTSPEYYEVVTNPIDLLKIQQRMKTEEYDTVDDMVSDVELMINNAQAYYKVRGSDLWGDCGWMDWRMNDMHAVMTGLSSPSG